MGAREARELLSSRWSEPLELDDVVAEVAASKHHLCRIFRSEMGTTMHRFLRTLRLRRSLEKVAEEGSDLSTVAFEHGFSSHSHFTSSFRKEFGMTPTAFRHRLGSGSPMDLIRKRSSTGSERSRSITV